MKRIFQIGFNKCGTRTLSDFFEKNGLTVAHWERGELAEKYMARKARGQNPLADYPGTVFFSDMVKITESELLEPYKDFRTIHAFYPNSYYILNTRDCGDWLVSRSRHGKGSLVKRYRRIFGLDSDEAVFGHWRDEWDRHHDDVMRYFADFPGRLLVFHLGRDDGRHIVDFLAEDFSLDPVLYGHAGKTKTAPETPNLPEGSSASFPASSIS